MDRSIRTSVPDDVQLLDTTLHHGGGRAHARRTDGLNQQISYGPRSSANDVPVALTFGRLPSTVPRLRE